MPKTYQNNLSFLNIDVSQVDALIISHGHYDHIGGLIGFLEAQRPLMRKDLRSTLEVRTISAIGLVAKPTDRSAILDLR